MVLVATENGAGNLSLDEAALMILYKYLDYVKENGLVRRPVSLEQVYQTISQAIYSPKAQKMIENIARAANTSITEMDIVDQDILDNSKITEMGIQKASYEIYHPDSPFIFVTIGFTIIKAGKWHVITLFYIYDPGLEATIPILAVYGSPEDLFEKIIYMLFMDENIARLVDAIISRIDIAEPKGAEQAYVVVKRIVVKDQNQYMALVSIISKHLDKVKKINVNGEEVLVMPLELYRRLTKAGLRIEKANMKNIEKKHIPS